MLMSKKIQNKNPGVIFFCLLSSRSAIGDGFVQLLNHLGDNVRKTAIVAKTNTYLDAEFDLRDGGIINFELDKKRFGFLELVRYICRSIKFLFLGKFSGCFVYGTSPLNYFSAFFVRTNRLFIWSHDPVLHSQSKFFEKIGLVSEKLLVRFRRSKCTILVASETLTTAVLNSFGPVLVATIPFPFVEAIVNSSHAPVQYSERSNVVRLLFFGRVEYYKGIDLLIAALDKVRSRGFNFEFLIVGPGIDYFDAPKYSGYHRVGGYVENHELKSYILSSDLCIFPYRDATGTQAVQTSLALGMPCLLSSVPLFLEFCDDVGVSLYESQGTLVDFLIDVISRGPISEEDRKIISTANREKYDVKTFAERVDLLLRES